MKFLKLYALKVSQPLADFYIAKIKANDLLKIAFSEELKYTEDGRQKGSQRIVSIPRLKEIAKYIDSVEMSFPTSIILAANYNEDGIIEDHLTERWSIRHLENEIFEITIPSERKLAAIIDGQHRLKAFDYITNSERRDIEVPCAIFFDLPNSYQAFLFATINGNQKSVSKSLALEQFGYNVEDEPKESWTPEKLAVYLCRRLNLSKQRRSVFFSRIKLAPKYDANSLFGFEKNEWIVSTATIVDGILSLISSNPKRDRVIMGQKHIFRGRNRNLLREVKDSSPLRNLYLKNSDETIFNIVFDFFYIANETLWVKAYTGSYIIKTVGIQALFDLLKIILSKEHVYERIDYSKYLSLASEIDFSDNYFQASGVGRSRIKKVLFYLNGFETRLSSEDKQNIERLIGKDID